VIREVENEKPTVIPTRLIQAVGALLLICLTIVAYARITDMPLLGIPEPSPIEMETLLRFQAYEGSRVVVYNQENKALVDSSVGPNGFVQVVYKGFSYERKKKNVSNSKPVRLVLYEDGRLAVVDDSTSWSLQLGSFGSKNAAVFGDLFVLEDGN
jgi:putative photosynthetic complex assembly protein